MRSVSAGILVHDGNRLLLGHATRSPRWDIPKGGVEPGEDFVAAALRELREETGLTAPAAALVAFGIQKYLPAKDLALFAWRLITLPDPATLHCDSLFTIGDTTLPEFDRFGLFTWDEALHRVGKNMARVLAALRPQFHSA